MLKKILKRFNQSDFKPAMTLFDANCNLKKNVEDAINQLEYSQIIESLSNEFY